MPTIVWPRAHAYTYVHARAHDSMYRMKDIVQDRTPLPADARPARARPESGGRRIQVRRSGVHGKGVFALQPIAAGQTIIEYKGEVITWPEALRRHPHDPADPHHTFYFHVDDKHVIDAKFGGNAARWINHACDPNCEADEVDGRIFIKALRDLYPGEELFYDYGLVIDDRYTPRLKKQYECRCGSPRCRHTMLAAKR